MQKKYLVRWANERSAAIHGLGIRGWFIYMHTYCMDNVWEWEHWSHIKAIMKHHRFCILPQLIWINIVHRRRRYFRRWATTLHQSQPAWMFGDCEFEYRAYLSFVLSESERSRSEKHHDSGLTYTSIRKHPQPHTIKRIVPLLCKHIAEAGVTHRHNIRMNYTLAWVNPSPLPPPSYAPPHDHHYPPFIMHTQAHTFKHHTDFGFGKNTKYSGVKNYNNQEALCHACREIVKAFYFAVTKLKQNVCIYLLWCDGSWWIRFSLSGLWPSCSLCHRSSFFFSCHAVAPRCPCAGYVLLVIYQGIGYLCVHYAAIFSRHTKLRCPDFC